jgi:hypothetical protein
MAIKKGDRVFHRGLRIKGRAITDMKNGVIDVEDEHGQVTTWGIGDVILDQPGATDPNQPGRGHLTDPASGAAERRCCRRAAGTGRTLAGKSTPARPGPTTAATAGTGAWQAAQGALPPRVSLPGRE